MTELEQEKYLRILQAAQEVILKYGYRKTTMGDLAKAAKMSRPALYLHFKNKDEVFRAAVREMGKGYFRKLETLLPDFEGDLAEKISLIFEVVFTEHYILAHTSPHVEELMVTGYEVCDEEVEEVHKRLRKDLSKILEEAGKSEPKLLAAVLVSSARGIKKYCKSEKDLRSSLNKLAELAAKS